MPLVKRVEILHEMLGFDGWRRWPLKVTILDEEVVKIWVEAGKREGITDIPWESIGDDIFGSDVEVEVTTEEQKRDLNLKKLMKLDLHDCLSLRDES